MSNALIFIVFLTVLAQLHGHGDKTSGTGRYRLSFRTMSRVGTGPRPPLNSPSRLTSPQKSSANDIESRNGQLTTIGQGSVDFDTVFDSLLKTIDSVVLELPKPYSDIMKPTPASSSTPPRSSSNDNSPSPRSSSPAPSSSRPTAPLTTSRRIVSSIGNQPNSKYDASADTKRFNGSTVVSEKLPDGSGSIDITISGRGIDDDRMSQMIKEAKNAITAVFYAPLHVAVQRGSISFNGPK